MSPLIPLLLVTLAAPPNPDPSAEVFKASGAVPKLKITVDKENLTLLGKDTRKYVRATVRIGDQELHDVGLHLKGAAGSYRDWNDKPGLTLNFDKFVKGQTYRGLDKVNLNNSVQDGSALQEQLVNEMLLAAGHPACRCAQVLVELNGRKVGVYVLKEGFNKAWLRRHFDDANGNLYDGGFLTDINGPLKLDNGTDNGRKDLLALAKACSEGDADKRYAAVGKLVDVDKFFTSAAVQILTADWDGYIRKPNNYRIYFDPKSGKATFIPHGLDQMWQNPGEQLWHGWGGMAARAILDHPDGKKKAIERLKEIVEKQFVIEKLFKRIDELAPRTKAAVESVYGKGGAAAYENEVKWLKERLKQRAELLKRDLPKLK